MANDMDDSHHEIQTDKWISQFFSEVSPSFNACATLPSLSLYAPKCKIYNQFAFAIRLQYAARALCHLFIASQTSHSSFLLFFLRWFRPFEAHRMCMMHTRHENAKLFPFFALISVNHGNGCHVICSCCVLKHELLLLLYETGDIFLLTIFASDQKLYTIILNSQNPLLWTEFRSKFMR